MPLPFDPFEIACLRGGEREAYWLLLFDLVLRQHLVVIEARPGEARRFYLEWDRARGEPEIQYGPERDLVGWFATRRSFSRIRNSHWRAPVASFVAGRMERLITRGLLKPSRLWQQIRDVLPRGLAQQLAIEMHGWRRTATGASHLRDLQRTFGHLSNLKAARLGANDPLHVGAVSLFGIAALEGTGFDAFVAGMRWDTGWSITVGSGCGGYADSGCGGGGCGGCGG